jgi:Asp-tRNA(Asn)/Glu-tRNA(Gln) amidotransferase A subunit family amidase
MNASPIRLDLYERIDQVETRFETQEPQVMAFVFEAGRFDRLRTEAAALLARYPIPQERPPLFGDLVGVKDIFHVDGFETRAGSSLPPDALHGMQAESVSRLQDAGALILGKTVTTEFAYFSPGPTRNPRNFAHTPGGSSSGSAAAVAAGLCTLALGTQTIGSIIRPASFCGVVGMKPSYERISRLGVIPLSPSLDHVGFFTPDVAEAKRVAPILCKDWDDRIRPRKKPILGIPDGPYLTNVSEYGVAHFKAVCNMLARGGYEIRHAAVTPDFAEIRERHNLILAAEAAHVHAVWFEKYGDDYAPKTAELIRNGQKVSAFALAEARRGQERLRVELNEAMYTNQIDLWICPSTTGPAPKGLDSTGDPVMNLPWTQAGMPALNLPAGQSPEGLPMGLQVTAGWAMDEALLSWAEGLEGTVANL